MHLILDWQTGECSVKCHKAVEWIKCLSYEEMPADWGFIRLEMTQLQEDLRAISQHLPGGYGKAKGRLFTVVHSWRVECNCHTSKWEDLTAARKELSSCKDKHANRLPKKILVSVCGNFQDTTAQIPSNLIWLHSWPCSKQGFGLKISWWHFHSEWKRTIFSCEESSFSY